MNKMCHNLTLFPTETSFQKKLPKNWFFMCPITFSYLHMLQILDAISTNSMKNNIAFIILQCCSITPHCNATTCAITWCITIIKIKATNILCLHSFIVCNKIKEEKKNRKLKKTWKKWKREQKSKANVILTCWSHIFDFGPSNWTPHL